MNQLRTLIDRNKLQVLPGHNEHYQLLRTADNSYQDEFRKADEAGMIEFILQLARQTTRLEAIANTLDRVDHIPVPASSPQSKSKFFDVVEFTASLDPSMIESLQKINHHLSFSDYMVACNLLRGDYPTPLRVFAALRHYDRNTKSYSVMTAEEVLSESSL